MRPSIGLDLDAGFAAKAPSLVYNGVSPSRPQTGLNPIKATQLALTNYAISKESRLIGQS
jgi:hypothetical protein